MCIHKYPHHKGLLQVVCHVLLYVYYYRHSDKMEYLKKRNAIDNRGWVVDNFKYDDMVAIWKPDEVVLDLEKQRASFGGFCSTFIFCT